MLVSKICGVLAACNLAMAQDYDLSVAVGTINQARQSQGLQPLTWNGDLAAYASFWSDQMATGAVPFGHASGRYRPSQGETLFERQSGGCDAAYENPLQTAVNGWLAEAQIMWSSTTHIGCARSYGISQPYQVYSVCRFYPEGNLIGQTPF